MPLFVFGIYVGVELLGHRIASFSKTKVFRLLNTFPKRLIPMYSLSTIWFPVSLIPYQHLVFTILSLAILVGGCPLF